MAPSGEKVKTNPGARVLMEEVGALGISVDDCQKEGNRVAKPGLFTHSLSPFISYLWSPSMCQELYLGTGARAVSMLEKVPVFMQLPRQGEDTFLNKMEI